MYTVNYPFGNCLNFQIPCEIIAGCSASGDVTEEVFSAVKGMDEDKWDWPPIESMRTELRESGGWSHEILEAMTDQAIKEKFLWIACCNIAEEMLW